MDLGLKGLNAIVTGGTRGIGRAIAETLAAEGANVAICARNEAPVKEAVDALSAKGVKASGAAVDVADGSALPAWVRSSAERLGGIDIVVANVSALAIGGDEESWRKGFETDMMGTVRLVDAAMPYLEKSNAASIVTISSVSGREIDFAAGPYGAFKAAIIHYTQGLAYQLAAKRIRANSVSPGNTYFEGGVWNQIEVGNPTLYATALALNPTGRMGTPQEMANAVAFLASPAASFVTGTNLVVDGALTRGVQDRGEVPGGAASRRPGARGRRPPAHAKRSCVPIPIAAALASMAWPSAMSLSESPRCQNRIVSASLSRPGLAPATISQSSACSVASESRPVSTWRRSEPNWPCLHWPQSSTTILSMMSVSESSTALIVP